MYFSNFNRFILREFMTPEQLFVLEKTKRDLLWACQSPLLIHNQSVETIRRRLNDGLNNFFNSLTDEASGALPAFDPRFPLGRWFEKLIDFALRYSFGSSFVHKGLSDGFGGELDFVVCDNDWAIHIECAVKYFLFRPDLGAGFAAFVGPRARDRLDLKYERMTDIQLQRKVPDTIVGHRTVVKALWMGGGIFYPVTAHEGLPSDNQASSLNLRHSRGVFGSPNELFRSVGEGDHLIELPPLWWITSLDGFNHDCLDLFPTFSGRSEDGAKMVAQVRVKDRKVHEVARGFVV